MNNENNTNQTNNQNVVPNITVSNDTTQSINVVNDLLILLSNVIAQQANNI